MKRVPIQMVILDLENGQRDVFLAGHLSLIRQMPAARLKLSGLPTFRAFPSTQRQMNLS